MTNLKVGLMLIGRMLWNALCLDFASVGIYALLCYIHFFAGNVEVMEVDDGEEDQDT